LTAHVIVKLSEASLLVGSGAMKVEALPKSAFAELLTVVDRLLPVGDLSRRDLSQIARYGFAENSRSSCAGRRGFRGYDRGAAEVAFRNH
jgi:hypothetical protein